MHFCQPQQIQCLHHGSTLCSIPFPTTAYMTNYSIHVYECHVRLAGGRGTSLLGILPNLFGKADHAKCLYLPVCITASLQHQRL